MAVSGLRNQMDSISHTVNSAEKDQVYEYVQYVKLSVNDMCSES
jgi:hypothetical protein